MQRQGHVARLGNILDESDLLKELRIDSSQRDDDGDDQGARRRLWRLGVGTLVVLLLAGTAWFFFGARPIPVQTARAASPAIEHQAAAVLQATGYVTARRQATVSAQITGTLTQVLIEEGDHVKKGQVLARLENKAQQASLDQAEADVAAARAQVISDRAQLVQGQSDMRRQETLGREGVVSKQAAEQARTQVDSLRAQLEAHRKQVDAARARQRVAQVQFNYTVVRAPFNGVITAKAAQVGEIVSPLSAGGGFTRTGVGTIVDMDSLEVDVDVNESYIGRVKPGMPAQAVLDAYPDWTIPAHVIAIVPAADRSKATVPVRVALDQKDDRVVPNMGARVSFLESRPKQGRKVPSGVLIPDDAIVRRHGHAVVFVVDGGVARLHRVAPAEGSYGDLKRITSGLAVGAEVVVKPPRALVDGGRVRVKTNTSS